MLFSLCQKLPLTPQSLSSPDPSPAGPGGSQQGAWIDLKGQTATQSSTTHGGSASRAIDGNTSPNWGDGSCTHTDYKKDKPYWQVTLPAGYTITAVKIYNRADCCTDRILNIKVKVDSYECGEVTSLSQLTVACAAAPVTTSSSVLRLYKESTTGNKRILTLCEVKVQGSLKPQSTIRA